MNKLDFDALVFAGGGSRCFWQLGFWSVLKDHVSNTPDEITASSAGCAMACACLLNREEETLTGFMSATAKNPKNLYLSKLLRHEPALPHERMYRAAILNVLGPGGAKTLAEHKTAIKMVYTRPPRPLGGAIANFIGLSLYELEKRIVNPIHQSFAKRAGFAAEVGLVSECKNADEIADLILASSCSPPLTPIYRRGGETVLDGGVFDAAPVHALDPDRKKVLVLLSRPYRRELPKSHRFVYAQPSRPVTVKKWDYANPRALELTYNQGKQDAEDFLNARP